MPKKKRARRRRETIAEIQSCIRKKSLECSMNSLNIGLAREDIVLLALQEMKRDKLIRDYIPSARLGKADLAGIDFTVIAVKKKYETIYISVTGPKWVSYHKEKHPNIPVLAVEKDDTLQIIKKKILAIVYHSEK